MIALAYLLFFGVYFWLMVGVVRWAWKKGIATGSRLKAFLYAVTGFLAVYLPLFWNHIPVVLTHKAMCARDAGFTEYVTPDQWVSENRERLPDLKGINLTEIVSETYELNNGFHRYLFFGGMLSNDSLDTNYRKFSMNFYRTEFRTVDVGSGKIMTKTINYSVGPREDARFWLVQRSCFDDDNSPSSKDLNYIIKLRETVR